MTQQVHVAETSVDDDYVPFSAAGEIAKGEFHCAECGYGIAVCRELPVCPMCAGESWEPSDWSPFGRAPDGPLSNS
jgi:hypothetical protein